MSKKNDEFAPLPTYTETSNSNGAWVAVTITKDDGQGNVTQTSIIVSKPR